MNKMLKAMLAIVSTVVLVMAGCSPASIPEAEDGEEQSAYLLEANLLGEEAEFSVDGGGAIESKVELSSADGGISLSVDEGTVLLDQDGEPLRFIEVTVESDLPVLPQDAHIIGEAYNLEPQGAAFDPYLSLTLSYDPEELPEGVSEDDLYIAYHDGAEWHESPYKRLDTAVHSVTTQVYSFTVFAVLGPKEGAPKVGIHVGNLAPDFQLPNLDRESVSLYGLRGEPVMLNFWTTWCAPCRIEMPYLQGIHEEYSEQGLILLAINIGESSSAVEDFLQSRGYSFPVLLDTSGVVAQQYGALNIPTTYFIDEDGVIQSKRIGPFSGKGEIESELAKIMPVS